MMRMSLRRLPLLAVLAGIVVHLTFAAAAELPAGDADLLMSSDYMMRLSGLRAFEASAPADQAAVRIIISERGKSTTTKAANANEDMLRVLSTGRRAACMALWRLNALTVGYAAGHPQPESEKDAADAFLAVSALPTGGRSDAWQIFPVTTFDPFHRLLEAKIATRR